MPDRSKDLDFLGAERTDDASWRLPVTEHLTTPPRFLFGGAAIAMAAAAMETVAERPLVWITTQYVSNAYLDEAVDVTVELPKVGGRTAQARVHGRVSDREIFTAVGAVGIGRPDRLTGTWIEMPRVPPPDECPEAPWPTFAIEEKTIIDETERRLPAWEGPRHHAVAWTRMVATETTTPPMLGWIADCIPMGFAAATGELRFGTSLDNTLRLAAPGESDWILVDVRVVASQDGYGYGDVHLWAEDGTLLGTGTQTAVLRTPPKEMPRS